MRAKPLLPWNLPLGNSLFACRGRRRRWRGLRTSPPGSPIIGRRIVRLEDHRFRARGDFRSGADVGNVTFLAHAPAQLHLPLLLGLWTGQRQGDLLRLSWSGYDGEHIRLRQSKTGARVVIPVGAPLKAALDAAPRRSPIMLTSKSGKPWTEGGFRASWRIGCDAAAITELTFNDLRGTAVTRLALVGCTEPEIATITGHSLSNVRSILDKHYLHRDVKLARSAINKLEMGYAKPAHGIAIR
jgi:integrase